ncbi:MAG TPA: gliding motility-associated C-terminal domain-containing protein, partial [Bacteroidia bacterium]|nr:gliding motility-associated C-terminal domain-containing protein [Bacteroidia bacterium]
IWDKNNLVMLNGTGLIGGGGTSTQAAIIIAKPGSNNLYYVITADQGGYGLSPNKGVFYSVIDMNQNAGKGSVILKNKLLTPPPTIEKLTAVKHCNGKDYWIITHSFLSNAYHAYLLTSSGIDSIDVVSNTGTVEQNTGGTYDETIGSLKASPNGKKLALCISYYVPSVEITEFDNSSGIISNPVIISYQGNPSPYGLSFSPDNSKLYVSLMYDKQILQYDVSNHSTAAINSSQTVIASQKYFCAMQLAPDGKIYVVNDTSGIGVIQNPDGPDTACNYQAVAVSFSTGHCTLGLPNFIDGRTSNSADKTIGFSLPNIVTPNDDSINDFISFGKYSFSYLQLEIYNRWGNLIFESNNPDCIWRPSCNDGTYYYTARYRLYCDNSNSEDKSLKGFIQVVR